MGRHIIEGERWIAERLQFLRDRLTEDPPEAEREAIEAEIAALSGERGLGGIMPRALDFPRLLRRIRRSRR